jgi:hypothetical protein
LNFNSINTTFGCTKMLPCQPLVVVSQTTPERVRHA